MNTLSSSRYAALLFFFALAPAQAQMPDAIAARGERVVAVMSAEGAQVYECKAEADGKPVWQFREPSATLMIDGRTVGRHFAGPNWELANGSGVTAKVVGRAGGATARDIPLLKLEVTERRGAGLLSTVTTIQRIDTQGGVLEGACASPGALMSVPYKANYAFLQRVD